MMTIHRTNKINVFSESSQFLVNILNKNRGKKILLLLSGGSAVEIYRSIKYQVSSSKYNQLVIGQVDERFQPDNKDDANAVVIEKTGLWQWCEKNNVPYYPVSQEGTLEQAADDYNRKLEKLFKECDYKIAVLGIGEDGHTAGLLPGDEKVWHKTEYAVGYKLDTIRYWVRPTKLSDLGQENSCADSCRIKFRQRITITPYALSQLDQAIVVAVGEKKKEAIKDALNPQNIDNIDKYPAAIMQKMEKVDLFTDKSVYGAHR